MRLAHLLVITFLLVSKSIVHSQDTLSYVIDVVNDSSSAPYLNVQFTFPASKAGVTKLNFSNELWGQENIFNTLSSVHSDYGSIELLKDSNLILVKHPTRKRITVNYRISQDFSEPIQNELYYRPIIQTNYFHIFGSCLFLVPQDFIDKADKKFTIHIKWNKLPSPIYKIHNSFGSQNKEQIFKETSERFLTSLFVGGDFRIYDFKLRNKPIYFALRGDWKKTNDSLLFTMVKRTIESQRKFWNDFAVEYFSITLIPTYADSLSSSLAGEGLTNSFSCYFGNNDRLDEEKIIYLFNHELMHHWIGHSIITEEQETHYWFREGFTDYFAYKNMLASNLVTQAAYLENLNLYFIKPLYTSPVKEMPNDSITKKNFWRNKDYQKLPYARGYVFAFYLDMKIKKVSNYAASLNNVMLDILEYTKNKNEKFTNELFIQIVNKYLPDDITPEVTLYIMKGRLISFSKDNILDCLEMRESNKVYPEFLFKTKNSKEIYRRLTK